MFKQYLETQTLNESAYTVGYKKIKVNFKKLDKVLSGLSKIKTLQDMEKYFNVKIEVSDIDTRNAFENQGIFLTDEGFDARFAGKAYAGRWIFKFGLDGTVTGPTYG